jgi:hypothetical protein
MTHPDLLALLEEGIQNGRIAPHLANYIAAEMRGRQVDAMPNDDEEARAAPTPADRGDDAS